MKTGTSYSIGAIIALILSGCGGGGGGTDGGSAVSKAALDLNTTYVALDFINRGILGLFDTRVKVSLDGKSLAGEKEVNAIDADFDCDSGSYHQTVEEEGSPEAWDEPYRVVYQVRFDNCVRRDELIEPYSILYPYFWDLVLEPVSLNAVGEMTYTYSGSIEVEYQCMPGLNEDRICSFTQTANGFKVVSDDYNLTADYRVYYESDELEERDVRKWMIEYDGATKIVDAEDEAGWQAKKFSSEVTWKYEDGNITETADVDGYFEFYNLKSFLPFSVPMPNTDGTGESSDNPFWFYFDNFRVTEIDTDDNRDVRTYEGGFGYNCLGGYVTVTTPQVWDKNMSQEDLDGVSGRSGTPFSGLSEFSGADGTSATALFREDNETNRSFVTVSVGDEEVNTTLERIHDEVYDACYEK